jgi:hypothetical protein
MSDAAKTTEEKRGPRYKCVAVNDECDTCACCGRTRLKRVAWLLEFDANDPEPYGTTCAAHLLLEREPSVGDFSHPRMGRGFDSYVSVQEETPRLQLGWFLNRAVEIARASGLSEPRMGWRCALYDVWPEPAYARASVL